MDKAELAKRLKSLKISIADIERDTGFGQNSLGKYLKAPEIISDKWAARLETYLLEKEGLDDTAKLIAALRAENVFLKDEISELKKQIEQEAEQKRQLQAQIDALRPAANSWNQRMAATAEAMESAPESVLTTTASGKGAKVKLQDATKPNKTIKPITDPKPQTNYTVDTRPKMPAGLTLMQQIEWREKNSG